MLKWIRNYYVGEDVKNPGRARARIIVGKFVPGVYVVTLSDNPGNVLEILSTAELMQRTVRMICPPVVGICQAEKERSEWCRRSLKRSSGKQVI